MKNEFSQIVYWSQLISWGLPLCVCFVGIRLFGSNLHIHVIYWFPLIYRFHIQCGNKIHRRLNETTIESTANTKAPFLLRKPNKTVYYSPQSRVQFAEQLRARCIHRKRYIAGWLKNMDRLNGIDGIEGHVKRMHWNKSKNLNAQSVLRSIEYTYSEHRTIKPSINVEIVYHFGSTAIEMSGADLLLFLR